MTLASSTCALHGRTRRAVQTATETPVSNGLTPKDEKLLKDRLRQLEALAPKAFLLGGEEQRQLASLTARIKARLAPPSPAEIDAEVASLLARGDSFDWFQAALRSA
jgi:hypothetical protein